MKREHDEHPEWLNQQVGKARETLRTAFERKQLDEGCSVLTALDLPDSYSSSFTYDERLRGRLNTFAMYGSMAADSTDELGEWLAMVLTDDFRRATQATESEAMPPIGPSRFLKDTARLAAKDPEEAQKMMEFMTDRLPVMVDGSYLSAMKRRMSGELEVSAETFRLSVLGGRYDDEELSPVQALSLAYLKEIDYGEALPGPSRMLGYFRDTPIRPETAYVFRAALRLLDEEREEAEKGAPSSTRYLDAAVRKTLDLMEYMATEEGGESRNAGAIASLLRSRSQKGLSYVDIIQIGNGLTDNINETLFSDTDEARLGRIPSNVVDGLPLAIDRVLFVAAQSMSEVAKDGAPGQLCTTVHAGISNLLEVGILRSPLPKTVTLGDLWLHFLGLAMQR